MREIRRPRPPDADGVTDGPVAGDVVDGGGEIAAAAAVAVAVAAIADGSSERMDAVAVTTGEVVAGVCGSGLGISEEGAGEATSGRSTGSVGRWSEDASTADCAGGGDGEG